MKLIDLLEVVNESCHLEVINDSTGEILGLYDGRDSIDVHYNECDVVKIGTTVITNRCAIYAYIKCDIVYKEGYKRLNDAPIEIECVEDEHQEENDFKPSFWFNNRRYFIDDFTRTHNNPWVGGDWPEFIHAFESEEYYHPLYIELIGDYAVNVYERCN